jgi:anti-sigma regulatory factor (Ser/Thr protein kinase)
MIVQVADSSQVSAARRAATLVAKSAGLDEQKTGQVALVATELATNLLKHGGGGEMIISAFDDSSGAGVELMALDKGQGIKDLAAASADGFSTAGSPGTGLGSIRRQSNSFHVFSRPNIGTAILARIHGDAAKPPRAKPAHLIGAVLAPYPGETACGDAWAVADTADGPTLLVADGSGHGPLAAAASHIAVETFLKNANESCPRLMELVHRALAPTRGGAVAVARVDRAAKLVRFVGVGNITGVIVMGGDIKRMVSHNGTAGHVAPRIREFTYPYTGNPTVILHSDGLATKWDLAAYPGLVATHPSLVAGVLYRDHTRGRDDVSVVAMQAA